MKEGREEGRGATFVPVLAAAALVPAAAHVLRTGSAGAAAACLLWALACLSRRAWMRPVCVAVLLGFTAEWLFTMRELVMIRLAMDAPWHRLVAILLGVAALTAAAALAAWGRPGRTWFCRERETSLMQASSFALAALPLLGMALLAPHLLLSERLMPSFGVVQAMAAGFWAAWLCARLADRSRALRARMLAWRLFSVVFFVQFALAAAGWTLFAMTGELHVPVPGVIVAGVLYRGTVSFMPLLFLVSVLLAGPAWCSHLCYFGSWDAWAAFSSRPSPHPGPLRFRVLSLLLVCAAALLLARAPEAPAVALAAALGLLLLPAAVWVSRRKGWAAYCTGVCPLGLLACLLGRLSPWRLKKSAACTFCGACAGACRYGALEASAPERGPGLSCTLCRACEQRCPRRGLVLTWFGMGENGGAERAFVSLMSAMHALFLFSAMV